MNVFAEPFTKLYLLAIAMNLLLKSLKFSSGLLNYFVIIILLRASGFATVIAMITYFNTNPLAILFTLRCEIYLSITLRCLAVYSYMRYLYWF